MNNSKSALPTTQNSKFKTQNYAKHKSYHHPLLCHARRQGLHHGRYRPLAPAARLCIHRISLRHLPRRLCASWQTARTSGSALPRAQRPFHRNLLYRWFNRRRQTPEGLSHGRAKVRIGGTSSQAPGAVPQCQNTRTSRLCSQGVPIIRCHG